MDTATRLPRAQLPPEIQGDIASGWFRSVSDTYQNTHTCEFLRMGPGSWLVFGEYLQDAPHYVWTRESQLRAIGVILRGGGVVGFAPSPHQRFALTEGNVFGIAYNSDTLVCRTSLPGVRNQVVTVYFESDNAIRQFGLDVDETLAWLSQGQGNPAAPGLSFVHSTPSSAALKAAQAICWAPYHGARRKLYLRSKAAEMLCHVMSGTATQADGLSLAAGRTHDDASLAALAHEAVSDPEHCPDVMEVARRLNVTAGRLLAAFRTTYGISLRDHMSATRMTRARQLLQSTTIPLLEVALACGYEHHSSFSTAYRRCFGETPIETRRSAAAR